VKELKNPSDTPEPARRQPGARSVAAPQQAFTLIELLTVITIIGILAGLIVGLAPLASRKMKESRMRTELTQLGALIEDYKAEFGFYPPDNPATNRMFKWKNPLYYELTGAEFTRNGTFRTVNGHAEVGSMQLAQNLGVTGISNSKRDGRQITFSHNFKESQFKEIPSTNPNADQHVDVLVAPLLGEQISPLPKDVNPWFYDSSSPYRNNPNSFDLWADVKIGRSVFRFSNWSGDPILLK
jgi:prepilin-type N-terminal cleavage/methylation domain-containing protein